MYTIVVCAFSPNAWDTHRNTKKPAVSRAHKNTKNYLVSVLKYMLLPAPSMKSALLHLSF